MYRYCTCTNIYWSSAHLIKVTINAVQLNVTGERKLFVVPVRIQQYTAPGGFSVQYFVGKEQGKEQLELF